jgi:hypothetical protein
VRHFLLKIDFHAYLCRRVGIGVSGRSPRFSLEIWPPCRIYLLHLQTLIEDEVADTEHCHLKECSSYFLSKGRAALNVELDFHFEVSICYSYLGKLHLTERTELRPRPRTRGLDIFSRRDVRGTAAISLGVPGSGEEGRVKGQKQDPFCQQQYRMLLAAIKIRSYRATFNPHTHTA